MQVYDIETLKECFLYIEKDLGTEEYRVFEISKRKNQIDSLLKHLKETPVDYLIGFNNISFDWNVMQYILDTYEAWTDLDSMEVIAKIYNFAQTLISNQNYDILPPYREDYFDIAQIDLFTIHNFGNNSRKTSLKWIEFMMDMEVEEMPIHHSKIDLSEEDIEETVHYCKNDIKATEKLYNYTIGNTEHPLYKGRDKIQERIDVIREFQLPKKAINYSDVKLGESINLLGYMKEAKISNMSVLYDKKRNSRRVTNFTFGDCMPKYIKFQTPILKEFKEKVGKEVLRLMKGQEFILSYDGLDYTVARGGIHSINKPELLVATEEDLFIEFDCSSQYPTSIVKRGLYPKHLGKEWLINYKKLIQMRLDAKEKGKTDNKYKGISETLKISINGAGFGKLAETYSVQYDPFILYQCTVGNQFEILMLIEWCTMAGIKILSANTDGALCRVPKGKEELFYELCKKWEVVVGNTEMGKLEFTYYSKYVMTTINDFLAIKTNGEVKEKGDFLTQFELNKNKSKRIVPLALHAYYLKGTPIEETIKNHQNIFDFCIAKKASRDYYYKGINRKTGEINTYDKLIRYFICTSGEKIYKYKHTNSDKTGPEISECEAKNPFQKVFNKLQFADNFKDYQIDYDYYIKKAKELIYKLEPLLKREDREKDLGILSLF